jgi:hypothetical protein
MDEINGLLLYFASNDFSYIPNKVSVADMV